MIVVLFSSGIDSWACLNWAVQKYGGENVTPLYVDFGQCYADQELHAAHALCAELGINLFTKMLSPHEVLWEDPETKHVPLRNMMLLSMASMLPDVEAIVFGMIKGDWSEDKNPEFVHDMERLLNSQLVETIHRKKGSLRILTPFAYKTKAQVVRWCLNETSSHKYGVRLTIGCYSGGKSCGACISCFTRWVALRLNGMAGELNDHVYVKWMTDQMSSTRKSSKLTMLKLLWRKRSFALDAYRAMNEHCKERFGSSFIKMYLAR